VPTASRDATVDGWGESGANQIGFLSILQRCGSLLHHADPLDVVEPEVAVGDHSTRLGELVLGAKDERGGAAPTSSSEWLQPERERVHEVHARPMRVAPSSEIDPALIDIAEVPIQRSSRLERLVDLRVEDHAWHPRIARLVFERGHQGACYAAPTVRLLDVEIAHHREAPGLGEHFGRAVFMRADADEPDPVPDPATR
jgi:hypothetical protein